MCKLSFEGRLSSCLTLQASSSVERVLKALPCQPKDPVHREDLPWKDAEFERMIEGREGEPMSCAWSLAFAY